MINLFVSIIAKRKKNKMTNSMKEALKELDYIEAHLEEYKKHNKWQDIKKELLEDE